MYSLQILLKTKHDTIVRTENYICRKKNFKAHEIPRLNCSILVPRVVLMNIIFIMTVIEVLTLVGIYHGVFIQFCSLLRYGKSFTSYLDSVPIQKCALKPQV